MNDADKSKAQLIAELAELRQQIAELEALEAGPRQMEKALRESQARFDLFMKHLPAAVFIKDRQGRLVYANERFAKILGYEPQELVGEETDPLTPAAIQTQFEEENQLVLSEGQMLKVESSFPAPSGPTYWLTYKFPIYKDGHPALVGGISLDVTERKRMEKALRESEARYRAIVEDQTELICRFQPDGSLTFVNGAYCRYFGRSYQELIGSSFLAFIPEAERPLVEQEIAALGKTQPISTYEHRVINRNGQIRWQQWTSRIIFDEQGNRTEYQAVGRDITNRRQMEETLWQANADLHRRLEELTVLNLTAQILATVTDLPQALEVISSTVNWLFEASSTGIGLLNADQSEVKLFAHFEQESLQPEKSGLSFSIPEDSLIHQVIEKGCSLVISDLQTDPRLARVWEKIPLHQAHCLMLVPLLAHGEIIGVIGIATDQVDREFSRMEVALAETIAGQVAGAIEVARLFEEERSQRQLANSLREVATFLNSSLDLETVLAKIFAQMDKVIPCDGGAVFLPEGDDLILVAGAGPIAKKFINERVPLAGQNSGVRVFNTGQLLIINNAAGDPNWMKWGDEDLIQAWMGAPLIVGQKTIGVLTVDSYEKAVVYRPEDGRILQIFANQAALAIHNARLYEQVRQDAITKTELLTEVNHRTKNSLMAINGLILAERRNVPAESLAAEVLNRLDRRLQGLIEAHTILSGSSWGPVPLSDLVKKVIEVVLRGRQLPEQEVALEVTPASIEVSPRQASNLVLILNELVTNTVKHTLPLTQGNVARITVRFVLENELIRLEYRDNGPGYPETVLKFGSKAGKERQPPQKTESHIGLHLIRQIVTRTLRGTLTLANDAGAVTTIRFEPEEREKAGMC